MTSEACTRFQKPLHIWKPVLAATAFALAATATQAGVVEVAYERPERYSDGGRGLEASQVQAALTRHLQALGESSLPQAQTLRITITEIDLAGEVRPHFRSAQDVRVLRGRADWPRIGLRYSLSEAGRVIASSSETVVDMNYLQSLPRVDVASAYPYEQRMLTRWFSGRFGAAAH